MRAGRTSCRWRAKSGCRSRRRSRGSRARRQSGAARLPAPPPARSRRPRNARKTSSASTRGTGGRRADAGRARAAAHHSMWSLWWTRSFIYKFKKQCAFINGRNKVWKYCNDCERKYITVPLCDGTQMTWRRGSWGRGTRARAQRETSGDKPLASRWTLDRSACRSAHRGSAATAAWSLQSTHSNAQESEPDRWRRERLLRGVYSRNDSDSTYFENFDWI